MSQICWPRDNTCRQAKLPIFTSPSTSHSSNVVCNLSFQLILGLFLVGGNKRAFLRSRRSSTNTMHQRQALTLFAFITLLVRKFTIRSIRTPYKQKTWFFFSLFLNYQGFRSMSNDFTISRLHGAPTIRWSTEHIIVWIDSKSFHWLFYQIQFYVWWQSDCRSVLYDLWRSTWYIGSISKMHCTRNWRFEYGTNQSNIGTTFANSQHTIIG